MPVSGLHGLQHTTQHQWVYHCAHIMLIHDRLFSCNASMLCSGKVFVPTFAPLQQKCSRTAQKWYDRPVTDGTGLQRVSGMKMTLLIRSHSAVVSATDNELQWRR